MPRPKPAAGAWDEVNRRVTFYCPAGLLAAIEREVAETGRSKTQVIVDRLRAGGLVDEPGPARAAP